MINSLFWGSPHSRKFQWVFILSCFVLLLRPSMTSATPETFEQQVSTQEGHHLHTEIEKQVGEILPQLDIESLKMSISDLRLEEGMVPVAFVSRQGELMDLEVLNARTSELPSFGQRRREHTWNANQLHPALLALSVTAIAGWVAGYNGIIILGMGAALAVLEP